MDTVSSILHENKHGLINVNNYDRNSSIANLENKAAKLRPLSDHECSKLTQILPLNDTTEPPDTSLNKRSFDIVKSHLPFDKALSVTKQIADNNPVNTSARAVTTLGLEIKDLPSVSKGFKGIDQQENRNLELNMWLNGYPTLGEWSDFDWKIPLEPLETEGKSLLYTLRGTTAKKKKLDHDPNFRYSRAILTNAKRQKLEKLYSQRHCFARYTTISKEPDQLRPMTLLKNEVPVFLFRQRYLYTRCDAIAITLDADYFRSQASFKKDAYSCSLEKTTVQLKNLSNHSKLQLQIDNKLQEHSERTYQPVYLSATSGKLKFESDQIYFTKPKKAKNPSETRNNSALDYNESLIPPYEPCDVQSILVPKIEFMMLLDQVLTNKSAYEKKHDLIDLPITIYDEQTGERIHCYERQLFNPDEKKTYFEKVKILRHLLLLVGVNPDDLKDLRNMKTLPIQAFNGASPKFFINFVLNLPCDFLKYFGEKEEILQLIDNLENKVDLKTLCKLLSDGANFNFLVKSSYSSQLFLKYVFDLLINTTNKKQSKDLIENQQGLIYLLMHCSDIKSQLSKIPLHFPLIPEHAQKIFFITAPDYVYKSALNLEFFGYYNNGYSVDRNIYLHCAGYVLRNMNDSLCTKIINSFVKNCIFPNTFNLAGNLYLKKNCLTILLHWKTLKELEPEILSSLKKELLYQSREVLSEKWSKLNVDLTPILSLTRGTEEETKNTIINKLAHKFYNYHMDYWSDYLQSDEFKHFPEAIKQATDNLPTLPDHLKDITLPTSPTMACDIQPLLRSLQQPFAPPLNIPDINNPHQTIRLILDRYYRTLGPDRVVSIKNLNRPARSHLHGSGHALRVSMNIRLLMQLLGRYDLAVLSHQQKQLLEYAAIYHDAAAEDADKDREEIDSAGFFRRDMIHNCPAIYNDDIIAIAEAMEHKEDDIRNEENEPINQQQRLYRRLLRFADRLDVARCLLIPEDFPNFEHRTDAGTSTCKVDVRLLDFDTQWLNHEHLRKTLVSCIHGLLDLAAVSGGATQDLRTEKGYIKNYQLNPNASERLNQFFEKTPKPLEALEDLLDDNVRRCIAQSAGLTTCRDPEHRQCDQQQEHNHQRGFAFGYTRYIHNRYHDLVQVRVPEMQLWEKLAIQHAHELLSPALQSAIRDEVQRLREVGIKRNIGNPSQETLAHPEVQQFLKTHHGLEVVAESKLREVIPATVKKHKVHRYETILMLRPESIAY